jgi:hypothetical protein
MHLYSKYESVFVRQRKLNTGWVQNDLEKVGLGDSSSNSLEKFPRCTYIILNMKFLRQLWPLVIMRC